MWVHSNLLHTLLRTQIHKHQLRCTERVPINSKADQILKHSNNKLCTPRSDTLCLRPLQVDNIFLFIRQVAPVPACWLFKTSATS